MKLAFCLFKYFPFGGLQRDFRLIAEECRRRGHEIIVYAGSWEGELPDGFELRLLSVTAFSNHGKAAQFSKLLCKELDGSDFDCVVGFNRMAGLDVYFAADKCFKAKARQHSVFYRLTPRSRTYHKLEAAVFSPDSTTRAMLLTERQKSSYSQNYGTPENRLMALPPGLPEKLNFPTDREAAAAKVRAEFAVAKDGFLLLLIGSGFKTKGVDRAVKAVSALPRELRDKVKLVIAGKGKPRPLQKLADKLGIADQIIFVGARNDVPELLSGADLMLHPSVTEAAGNVLLEAVVAGLPVLCSGECGYAHYIAEAGAGRTLPEPFAQPELNECLRDMLTVGKLPEYGKNAEKYAASHDLYGRHIAAANFIEQVIKEQANAMAE